MFYRSMEQSTDSAHHWISAGLRWLEFAFEFRHDGIRARTDFFTRPPRMTDSDLEFDLGILGAQLRFRSPD